jgi:hypothetical protein
MSEAKFPEDPIMMEAEHLYQMEIKAAKKHPFYGPKCNGIKRVSWNPFPAYFFIVGRNVTLTCGNCDCRTWIIWYAFRNDNSAYYNAPGGTHLAFCLKPECVEAVKGGILMWITS